MSAEPLAIDVAQGARVSALLDSPPDPLAVFVFAHGAGAGMSHSFMAALAGGLAGRGIATLRYQFPYMERGSRRVDPPALAHAAVRAAVAKAASRLPGVPLFAGGKSFGGRMTSQAQAASALPGVGGIVFVGFPLHPAGKPSTVRADHLAQVALPMLFLQGTRDELADLELLKGTVEGLGKRATLKVFEHADHSFHVPARSGSNDAQVREKLLDAMERWMVPSAG